jgi:hypothetical protein
MKSRVIRIGIVIAALILVGGAQAQAQTPSLQVGFSFIAAGKMLSAGNYTVDIASNGNVVLTPEKGGAAVEMPQLKTMGNKKVERVELVFETSGFVKYLTEVWLPGKPGCSVGRVDDVQDRQTVSGPKPKK